MKTQNPSTVYKKKKEANSKPKKKLIDPPSTTHADPPDQPSKPTVPPLTTHANPPDPPRKPTKLNPKPTMPQQPRRKPMNKPIWSEMSYGEKGREKGLHVATGRQRLKMGRRRLRSGEVMKPED